MEANFLRSEDVKSSQMSTESNPSQNFKLKPKGLISRVLNWCLNSNGNWLKRGIVTLATILVATSSGLHQEPLGNAGTGRDMVENRIVMVFGLMILLVLRSGIPSGNKFCLWVLNLATVCIMYFQTVSYLRGIADMSPDMSVDPTTYMLCSAWMLLCLLFTFIHTVYFITRVVKELLKAITTTRNSDRIGV